MRRFALGVLVVGLAVVNTSCGVKEEKLPDSGNSLSGKVTYGGEPLKFGAIVIKSSTGSGITALKSDGTFLASNLELGEVTIGVDSEAGRSEFQSQMMAASYKGPDGKSSGKEVPKFVSVPAKFADPDKSGFKTTINKGPNTFNIEIPK